MKVEYSSRAYSDLEGIYEYYRRDGDLSRAATIEVNIREAMDRIIQFPNSGRRVRDRTNIRVTLLLQDSYKIFYAISGNRIRVVHIRHTSRKPWTP